VIQALHIARALENAVLDFTTLHESSVTNRKDATRAMDQLCQRIMASMQFQPQSGVSKSKPGNPSSSSMRSSFASTPISDLNESYDLPPSPPASVGSPRQPTYQRAFPLSILTIRHPSAQVDQRGRHNAPQALPVGWISSQVNHVSDDLTARNSPISTAGEELRSNQSPKDLDLKRRSQFSMQNSSLWSEKGSVHSQPTSATSTTTFRYSQDTSTRAQAVSEQPSQQSQQETISTDRATILASEAQGQANGSSFGDEEEESKTTKQRPIYTQPIEMAKNLQPDFEAPGAVSADFDGLHPISPLPDHSSEKYPAFRTQSDYAELLLSLPAGMDNIWMPLARPAMHNRYHGFCKGAWQIRKAVRYRLGTFLCGETRRLMQDAPRYTRASKSR
jgi:hypothetical protein